MSKIAIIIGFSYSLTSEEYKLPGVLVDLYLAYKWAKKINCTKIIVITDYLPEYMGKVILNAIINGEIDSDINFFIETIKKNKELHIFSTVDAVSSLIADACKNSNYMYIYYSGHSKDGYLLVPKYKHLATYVNKNPMDDFNNVKIDTLFKSAIHASDIDSEILIILDCCNSDNFMLPYELQTYIVKNNQYTHLNDKENVKKIIANDINNLDVHSKYTMGNIANYSGYNNRKVICISSSGMFSDAYSEHGGSNFTIEFFKIFNYDDIYRFDSIIMMLAIKLINISNIMPSMRSSHPNTLNIQPWMRCSKNISINYDNIRNVFSVKRGVQ